MPEQPPAAPKCARECTRECTVECTSLIAATPAAVFDFLARPQDFPRYMPNVVAVRVLERENGRGLSQWQTLLDGAPLNWVEEDTLEPPRRLSYRLLSGDIEHLEGEWLIEEAAGGRTRLTARLAYRLGVPIIEEVLGDIVRDKIRLNLEAMLRAARRRLEGRAAGPR